MSQYVIYDQLSIGKQRLITRQCVGWCRGVENVEINSTTVEAGESA